jgi:RNA polymerase sigma factor (sigma-70 family)
MNPDAASDPALLRALKAGDDEALNAILARWEGRLFAFAWRYTRNAADAQDLVAETFVRLYRQRERLAERSNLPAWLYTTLTNLCHNQHRWRRRHPSCSMEKSETSRESPVAVPAEDPGAAEGLEREESREALRAAIAGLTEELRLTLMLHYFEELSFREIGEITGCSERGVETRLYRARQQLRAALGGSPTASVPGA